MCQDAMKSAPISKQIHITSILMEALMLISEWKTVQHLILVAGKFMTVRSLSLSQTDLGWLLM